MSINEYTLGVRDTSKGINQCKCDTCDGAEAFSFSFRNGVPTYKYGVVNFVKFEVYQDSICINRVEITITYAPRTLSPPNPLPEYYLPFFIPPEFDRVGCPVCNADKHQWCSASYNNTMQLTLKDPLPINTFLVSADAYISLNYIQRPSFYLTTLTASIQETAIATESVSETGWKETCGCLGDMSFQSPYYQRGWPGYQYQGLNKITFTANKHSESAGNVCMGRLALKLVYYNSTDTEGRLNTLVVEDVELV